MDHTPSRSVFPGMLTGCLVEFLVFPALPLSCFFKESQVDDAGLTLCNHHAVAGTLSQPGIQANCNLSQCQVSEQILGFNICVQNKAILEWLSSSSVGPPNCITSSDPANVRNAMKCNTTQHRYDRWSWPATYENQWSRQHTG